MRKRSFCLLLALLVALPLAACRGRGGDSIDTSGSTETGGWVTDPSQGGEDTDPEGGSAFDEITVGSALEGLTVDGEAFFEGDLTEALTAADYTVALPADHGHLQLELFGWVGYTMAIDCFGYRLDGGDTVYGNFARDTEESIREAGGAYALRYAIPFPLFDLKPGAHSLVFLARLADGTEVPLLPALTVSVAGLKVDTTVPFQSSVTHINGSGPNGAEPYAGKGGSTAMGADIIDGRLNGHTVGTNGRITVSGWLATEGGVERYAWSVDGMTWYEAETKGTDGEPSTGYFSELGFENATAGAVFTELSLDLSPYQSRSVSVTVGGVPKDHPDRVIPFITITGLDVPFRPQELSYSFVSRADDNDIGTDLAASDLTYLFDICYGAGDLRRVEDYQGTLCYSYEGIHSLQAPMSGKYAFTVELEAMTRVSYAFARGTRAVVSVEPVALSLYNFYETDGLGLCGGAGIYANLADGTLTVVIKGLDPSVPYRIANHIFYFPADGRSLTLADDGDTVYILVDGREITRIALEGVQEYPEHFATVSPYIKFASTARIVTANGSIATVQDTLVSATCDAYCGLAIRGGGIFFTELSVIPFSEAGIRIE